ncbi:MAG: hypothetical protein ACRC6V_07320 [Bacteroidales bacterium]
MGKLFGGKGSGGSQTSESKPWEAAIPMLEKILANADKLFDEQGGINAEWIDKEIADLTPEMQQAMKDMIGSQGMKDTIGQIQQATQQGMSGIGQATGMLGGLANQGITSDNINQMAKDLYDQDTVDRQTGELTKNVQAGLDKNVQGINQRASGSGNMGSSRAGVAEGVAIGEASDAISSGSAAIQNAASQQAMAGALGTLQGNQSTALGAAGQLGSLGLGAGNLNLGTLSGQNQILQNALTGAGIGQSHNQNVADNKWFNAQGQQNMGWDMIGKLMGVGTGIGGMGGTNTQTGSTGSTGMFNSLVGGASAGAGIWNILKGGASSDISLKKNIKKKKGKTKKGEDQYTWDWNDSAKKRDNKKGKGEGVLAQQVAKNKPDAVGMSEKTGRLMVDYDKV